MINLEPISTGNALLFRAVRLRALQDAPSAFGSTYAKEVLLTDAEWVKRAAQWSSDRSVGFLAVDRGAACGIAGGLLDDEDGARAHLISMWTSPVHRQRGIGRLLVDGILWWAHARRTHTLQLTVVSSNEAAMMFYQRLGFVRTGRTEPYPNDPALIEHEMARAIR